MVLTGNNEIPNTLIEAMAELTSILPTTGFKIKHLALFDIEFSIQARHATSRNSGTPVTLIRSPTQRMGDALNALRP